MAPRTRRGTGVRAVLAGGLIALIAATVAPASAAAAPEILANSIATGWGGMTVEKADDIVFETQYPEPEPPLPPHGIATALKARKGMDMIVIGFDKALDNSITEPATVPDSNIVVNEGTTQISGFAFTWGPGLVWVADAQLKADGTEYTAIIDAETKVANTNGPKMATLTIPFRVDRARPKPPTIKSMSGDISAPKAFVDAGNNVGADPIGKPLNGADFNISLSGSAPISGDAQDNTELANDELLATSGIQRVELWFYDSFGGLTHIVDVENEELCADQCSEKFLDWSSDLSEAYEVDSSPRTLAPLPSGIWTMKAVAVDLAGLKSTPTRGIQFLHV